MMRLGKSNALEIFTKALPLSRAIGDREGEAAKLNNIALIYESLGEMEKALELFGQALAIFRTIGARDSEATALGNMASVHQYLGQKKKALELHEQVLEVHRSIPNPSGEALALNNIGVVYANLGDRRKALEFYNRALPLFKTVGDLSGEAITLGNIGVSYDAQGELRKGLEFLNQSLLLSRSLGDRAAESTTLNNIGWAYARLGEREKALEFYNQALLLSRALGDREEESITLDNLMRLWKEIDGEVAVFFGKQAVNTLQQLRANIRGLDKNLQRSFLRSQEDVYRTLADLLISRGRLTEAQQVLGLLKEEEYFEFVRRNTNTTSLAGARIAFTPGEAELEKRFSEIISRLTQIGSQRSALLALKERTLQQESRLAELEAQLETGNLGFQRFLGQLETELKTTGDSSDVVLLRGSQTLKGTLRELDAIALYTIVGAEKVNIILSTPDIEKAYEYKITESELNKKIFAFREALQNPNLDPLPFAQELYRILVGAELARDIAQTRKATILWSLDGTLRYLPLAALHDGKEYLVQNYRNVVITLASRDHLKDPVSSRWQALGLGVSKGEVVNTAANVSYSFPPLPGAREELTSIVRDETKGAGQKGILTGRIMLDEDFTAEAMKSALRLRGNEQSFKLVHIASHFNFEPGDETKSFLLLGGGQTLTLAEIKSMPQVFSRVELLTLSACNTATGGEARGREVEGFAVLAQRQGAKAIIASLWPVSDASTSELMRKFYSLRTQRPGISKAEAMRLAQLSLLDPTVSSSRPAAKKPDNQSQKASTPLAHPYYWAPFILIGNWR